MRLATVWVMSTKETVGKIIRKLKQNLKQLPQLGNYLMVNHNT